MVSYISGVEAGEGGGCEWRGGVSGGVGGG